MDGVTRMVDGDVEVIIDRRHDPVIVTTWMAAGTIGIAEQYVPWMQALIAEGREHGKRFVMISDARSPDRPDPVARRRFAEVENPPDVILASIVVVRSAAVRGALTAIRWMMRNAIDFECVADLAGGFELGRQRLREHGLAWPDSLTPASYRVPGEA